MSTTPTYVPGQTIDPDALHAMADDLASFRRWIADEYACYPVILTEDSYAISAEVEGYGVTAYVSVELEDDTYEIDPAAIVPTEHKETLEEAADLLRDAATALDNTAPALDLAAALAVVIEHADRDHAVGYAPALAHLARMYSFETPSTGNGAVSDGSNPFAAPADPPEIVS